MNYPYPKHMNPKDRNSLFALTKVTSKTRLEVLLKEQLTGSRSCTFSCDHMTCVLRISDITRPQNSVRARCGTEKEQSIPTPGCGVLTKPWGKRSFRQCSSQMSHVWKCQVSQCRKDAFWETVGSWSFSWFSGLGCLFLTSISELVWSFGELPFHW